MAGCGIWLYQFLIIAYLFTLEMSAEHMLYSYLIANFLSTHIKVRFIYLFFSKAYLTCYIHRVKLKYVSWV